MSPKSLSLKSVNSKQVSLKRVSLESVGAKPVRPNAVSSKPIHAQLSNLLGRIPPARNTHEEKPKEGGTMTSEGKRDTNVLYGSLLAMT